MARLALALLLLLLFKFLLADEIFSLFCRGVRALLVLGGVLLVAWPARAEDSFRITCRVGGQLGSTTYRIFVQPPAFLASVITPDIRLEAPDTSRMSVLEYSAEKITATGEAKLPALPKGYLTISVSRVTGRAQFLLTSRLIETRLGKLEVEKQYALAGPESGWCERFGTKF